MTPAATARAKLATIGEDFDEAVRFHMEHGYVWSSPRSFILARVIRSEWVDTDWWKLSDMTATDPEGDCWYIWLAAGDMAEFFEICQKPKDFVCFCRGEFPRLWEFERIKRLCLSSRTSPSRSPKRPRQRRMIGEKPGLSASLAD